MFQNIKEKFLQKINPFATRRRHQLLLIANCIIIVLMIITWITNSSQLVLDWDTFDFSQISNSNEAGKKKQKYDFQKQGGAASKIRRIDSDLLFAAKPEKFLNPCIDEYFFPKIVTSKFHLPPSNLLPPCMIRRNFTISVVPPSLARYGRDGMSLWLTSLPHNAFDDKKNSDDGDDDDNYRKKDMKSYRATMSLGPDLRWKLVDRLAMISLLRLFRNATADLVLDEKLPVVCLLSIIHTRVCDEFEESLVGCINRLGGFYVIEVILPARCIEGSFWKELKSNPLTKLLFKPSEIKNDAAKNKTIAQLQEKGKKLPRGQIPTITTYWPEVPVRNHEYVPKEKRTYAQFIDEPVECTQYEKGEVRQRLTKVYPFGFSVPSVNVIGAVPRYKVFDFLPFFPARHMGARVWGRVNLAEEQLWFEINAASFYGFTHRRGGSDCQRHTELLSANVLPYFADLESFGMYSLPFLPRRLLVSILNDMKSVRHVGKVSAANMTIVVQEHEPYHSETSRELFMEGINHYGDPETKMKMIKRTKKPVVFDYSAYSYLSWTEHRTKVLDFNQAGTINTPKFDPQQYYQYANEALSFTKEHLTSGAFISSVLKLVGFEDLDPFEAIKSSSSSSSSTTKYNNRVLLIGRHFFDHIHHSIHNGFNELGINVTLANDFDSLPNYFYKDRVDLYNITETKRGQRRSQRAAGYGGGLTWSGRGWNGPFDGGEEHISADNEAPQLRERILNHEFALILFCYVFPPISDNRVHNMDRHKIPATPLPPSQIERSRNVIEAEIEEAGEDRNNNNSLSCRHHRENENTKGNSYQQGFEDGLREAARRLSVFHHQDEETKQMAKQSESSSSPPSSLAAETVMPPLTDDEASLRLDEINFFRQNLPFWTEVIKAYHENRTDDPFPNKKRILFFDHDDIASSNPKRKARMYHTLSEFGFVFSRELNDDVCY